MTKMKGAIAGATLLGLAVIVLVRATAAASASDIAHTAWNKSNIHTLRSFNVDDVFEFVDQMKDDPNYDVISTSHSSDSRSIEGFTWADLARNNQYRLVVVFAPPGTSLTNSLVIYTRSPSGKITSQVIEGDGIGLNGNPYIDAPKLIQDLDGDGKDELLVPKEWGSTMASASVISIKVYRLRDGKYVEASRDFSKFYDEQILPKLESEIAEMKRNPSSGEGLGPPAFGKAVESDESQEKPERALALFEMARDKILRVIGRDPKAGEKEASEWVKSGDYVLIGDAMSVFEDIGDHESDLQAAKLAWKHEARESFKRKAGQ
jgi:hypothetical protein